MFMNRDWLMFQIELTALAIAKIFFGKGSVEYQTQNEEQFTMTDSIYRRLLELLAEKRFCEAENLLFEMLDPTDRSGLELAVDFYGRLNRFSNEELEEHQFSREEVESGLRDAMKIYNVSIPELESLKDFYS